ncbi:hypothetical protein [Vibrio cionasavignyae]|uniref:hypothetical protein n=1 Tax=Vibrio cionasavignyae TaxID=2910252 RepID=UPI003D134F7A
MQLLADKTGEQFLQIIEKTGDRVRVQFISNEGITKGKPFSDRLSGLLLAGWSERQTSTAIGLERFHQGALEDEKVSFSLHQLFPLGRKVRLPSNEVVTIASYANTHQGGYYMYVRANGVLKRLKMEASWQLLPSDKLLALPYYPAPRTQTELDNIDSFDAWAGGF